MVFSSTVISNASTTKYWLKVNTKCNVVNVYVMNNGQWQPFKVMLCSCGKATTKTNATPKGTFKLKSKWRWLPLVAHSYGQYCSQIKGDYLFHSVPYAKYKKYSSQKTKEFNKLGKKASHGCVRLSTIDAKWIYKNCKRGTKITVYSSGNPGPFGKPEGIKVSTKKKYGWDPTDPLKSNPHFLLKKPVIELKSGDSISVEAGSECNLTSFVKAVDPNTFRDLTKSVKVYKTDLDTSTPGTYYVKYRVSNNYCGTAYKTFNVFVY